MLISDLKMGDLQMLFINNEFIEEKLKHKDLIPELEKFFASQYEMPLRHHHFYKTSETTENTLIMMPSWTSEFVGIKQVIVAPENQKLGLPSITALYTLFDAVSGRILATIEAEKMTSLRTACTSALVAKYLSRKDSKTLLILGGGRVAYHLVKAYAEIRDLDSIYVWMRNPAKLTDFVSRLGEEGISIIPVTDLEATVRKADIISTATLSKQPLISGKWIKAGTHLDLIGSHKPSDREVDDDAIRAGRIYVDSFAGAPKETGDLAIPIASGLIKKEEIVGDIVDLVTGRVDGRISEDEITIFKSAGLAVEDLCTATLAYRLAIKPDL